MRASGGTGVLGQNLERESLMKQINSMTINTMGIILSRSRVTDDVRT